MYQIIQFVWTFSFKMPTCCASGPIFNIFPSGWKNGDDECIYYKNIYYALWIPNDGEDLTKENESEIDDETEGW